MKNRILLAALLLASCEGPCRSPPEIYTRGEPDPFANEVIEEANICGWSGIIEWVDKPFDCSGIRANGCYWYYECPERITVVKFNDARKSALAHELGHACGTIPFD